MKLIEIYGIIVLLVLCKGYEILVVVYCDNELSHLNAFADEFSDIFAGDELFLYTSAEHINNDIKQGNVPDIVFMDIDLGNIKNGIDYAEEFMKLSPSTKIIYITAYTDKFIHELFIKSSNISGFLTKPVQREYLIAMLEKVNKNTEVNHSKRIAVSFQGVISKIDEDKILYVESDKHIIKIFTENKVFTSYEKLSDFQKRLSSAFVFSHKSFIVNMDKIKTLNSNSIILENDMIVPVSRSKYQECKESYLNYLKRDLFE